MSFLGDFFNMNAWEHGEISSSTVELGKAQLGMHTVNKQPGHKRWAVDRRYLCKDLKKLKELIHHNSLEISQKYVGMIGPL